MVQGDRLTGRRRLLGTAALSLALHAAVLGGVGAVGGNGGASNAVPGALQVRLAAAGEPAEPARGDERQRAPALLPAPARFYKSSELDRQPAPIELAPLLYPENEYVNRIAGVVRMRIYISQTGVVERTEIVSASPAGRFEQAAVDAVRATRFHPGMRGGRPVRSQKLIEVGFDPYGPRPGEAR